MVKIVWPEELIEKIGLAIKEKFSEKARKELLVIIPGPEPDKIKEFKADEKQEDLIKDAEGVEFYNPEGLKTLNNNTTDYVEPNLSAGVSEFHHAMRSITAKK